MQSRPQTTPTPVPDTVGGEQASNRPTAEQPQHNGGSGPRSVDGLENGNVSRVSASDAIPGHRRTYDIPTICRAYAAGAETESEGDRLRAALIADYSGGSHPIFRFAIRERAWIEGLRARIRRDERRRDETTERFLRGSFDRSLEETHRALDQAETLPNGAAYARTAEGRAELDRIIVNYERDVQLGIRRPTPTFSPYAPDRIEYLGPSVGNAAIDPINSDRERGQADERSGSTGIRLRPYQQQALRQALDGQRFQLPYVGRRGGRTAEQRAQIERALWWTGQTKGRETSRQPNVQRLSRRTATEVFVDEHPNAFSTVEGDIARFRDAVEAFSREFRGNFLTGIGADPSRPRVRNSGQSVPNRGGIINPREDDAGSSAERSRTGGSGADGSERRNDPVDDVDASNPLTDLQRRMRREHALTDRIRADIVGWDDWEVNVQVTRNHDAGMDIVHVSVEAEDRERIDVGDKLTATYPGTMTDDDIVDKHRALIERVDSQSIPGED